MTTPDLLTVGELVQALIHRYKDAAPSSVPVSQPAARSGMWFPCKTKLPLRLLHCRDLCVDVYTCTVCILQLMVPGAHGSHGENVLLPAEEDRGHVFGSVTVRLQVTVVGRVQETLLSCPGATLRPAQVTYLLKKASVFICCIYIQRHVSFDQVGP